MFLVNVVEHLQSVNSKKWYFSSQDVMRMIGVSASFLSLVRGPLRHAPQLAQAGGEQPAEGSEDRQGDRIQQGLEGTGIEISIMIKL